MALSRTDIVQAALQLLDEVGLERLSLRGLATKLEVKAATLYWYVKSKQELIDEMAAAMMAAAWQDDVPKPSEPWDVWLTWVARSQRSGMLSRRDGALLAVRSSQTDDQWQAVEGLLHMLQRDGFSLDDAMRGLGALTNFVLGSTLEEQQAMGQKGAVTTMQEPDTFPLSARALTGTKDFDAMFTHGLTLILDGMRLRVRRFEA
ncbi:TetR/AcrR family transcriptional regulator C-terminal domain-containing protein [Kitasatospora sp. NBC_01302]|uniref:TetR/AcrR family transcriptional regulator C-terminal domain-containing protein n=1 Tax=Kitasatospora sp. NBC_01302 TaxID=2903575 RepID=UPI002E12D4B8|nr:TetR/AcrR family transcriptional regulator C-terminal domain-containing protein [Kitasatospora sp. NBC_01302]